MSQEKYICVTCDYFTNINFCYKRHMASQKHKNKQSEADRTKKDQIKIEKLKTIQIEEEKKDAQQFEETRICMYCKKICTSSSGLTKHLKVCSEKSNMQIKIINLEKELQTKIETLEKEMQTKITSLEKDVNVCNNIIQMKDYLLGEKDKSLEDKERIVCELIKTLEYERIKEKSHLSASNYLSMTYNSAPNMKLLSDFAIFKNRKRINSSESMEGTDEDLLEIIINAYQNDHLVEFIGGALVSYYKTENPQDQCIWNSDTERLTYFIRRNFNWKIDKKGIKTETLIIAPALSHFYDILQKVVTSEIPRRQNVNIVLRDNEQRQVCYDIMLSIENGSLSGKILKFMAPYLFLDKKLKYIEAQTDIPPTKCIRSE